MAKLFMFDFECSKGHVFEDLQDPSDKQALPCPECGNEAHRIISTVRLDWQMGVDSGFPSAADKWARIQKQRAKRDNIDGPNLWMH